MIDLYLDLTENDVYLKTGPIFWKFSEHEKGEMSLKNCNFIF